jgi:hypothetical protein
MDLDHFMYYSIVAYLLHARTVTSKHGTLCNNRRSGVSSVLCRAVPSRASLIATQHCNKHISAAANQHPTIQKAVFSICPALTTHSNSKKGSRDTRLLFVDRCPTLSYIRVVSSVPDGESVEGSPVEC